MAHALRRQNGTVIIIIIIIIIIKRSGEDSKRERPYKSGFGGLEVACWLLVPKFAGSNPAEAVGFFRAKKSSVRLPTEGK